MKINKTLLRWLPAIGLMVVIFLFSSIPSAELPNLGILDLLVKKGAHFIGYGLLALAFWFGFSFDRRRWWLVLILTILYAISDEFHQSFVLGRHPSWVDALIIDGSGAGIMLLVASGILKKNH
jgi:VanZ family protein